MLVARQYVGYPISVRCLQCVQNWSKRNPPGFHKVVKIKAHRILAITRMFFINLRSTCMNNFVSYNALAGLQTTS